MSYYKYYCWIELQNFMALCKGRFNVFRRAIINVEIFSPKSGLILPQIVKISPFDVEISPPWPLFRNNTNSIAIN